MTIGLLRSLIVASVAAAEGIRDLAGLTSSAKRSSRAARG